MFNTKLLLLCIIFVAVSLTLLNASAFDTNGSDNINKTNVCTSEICANESKEIIDSINENVDPCENFYEFACGQRIRNTVLPANRDSQSTFTLLQDVVNRQLQAILTEKLESDEPQATKLAKIFNNACTDEATLNKLGIAPMVEILEKYGGWPVIKGSDWKPDNWNWLEINKQISNDGFIDLVLDWGIGVDLKNSTKNVLIIDKVSLGLPREFLVKGMQSKNVQAYYEFMVDVAAIFGANRSTAESELLDALHFEMELAKISLGYFERKNFSIVYNPFTIRELQLNYPYVNWLEYFNWHFRNISNLDGNETVVVVDKNYLHRLNDVIQLTSNRTIANYYGWRLVLFSSNLMNDELHNRRRRYFKAPPIDSTVRLTECVKKTMSYLSLSAGASYVRKHFNKVSKKEATDLARIIHGEFIKTLQNVNWMDEKSKAAAIAKANAMNFDVAYPDELVDVSKLNEYYEGLKLQEDSLLHNVLLVNKFVSDRKMRRMHMPINRKDWDERSTRTTNVDAFYSVPQNTIQLPAAVLQRPLFGVNRPAYLNFGGIGWAIAHEITHGFDNHGRMYDPNGNVINWWQEETINKFTMKAQCFIDQYSNYTDRTLNLTVSGKNTLSENIADNGGIKGMYSSYQTYVKENGLDPMLPGLNYTPNQLFWISAAQIWCDVTKPSYDKWFYRTNSHAPNSFRIIGSFSNSYDFSRDFNCAPDSKMNPVNKCELW